VRIFFLSHNRSDSNDAYNYRLRSLRSALEKEGIEASIAYLGDPPLGRPTLLHPMKISRVPGLMEADVIHAGSAAVAFSCAAVPREKGMRIVFDMHGDTVAEARLAVRGIDPAGRLRVWQEAVKERIGLRRSDHILVVSDILRQRLVDRGVAADKIEIVRNGVDLDRFPVAPDQPCREKPLIVYAGRFDPWQGVSNIEHLAKRAGEVFDLRIIGFGPADGALKERLRSLSEGRADLVDRVDQERLAALLGEADLLLIPRESGPVTDVAFPTKFAEYVALGRPVLMTRVGEPAAMVESEECGLVSECGGEALVEAARRFAALDEAARRSMGRRARALAEREFGWSKIGARYAAYLREQVMREAGR